MAHRNQTPRRGFFARLWGLVVILQRIIISIFVLGFVAVLAIGLFYKPQVKIDDHVALVWAPSGVIVEQHDPSLQDAFAENILGERRPYTVMGELMQTLEDAATDDRIDVLFLKLDELEYAGMAQLQELAAAIRQFKESGKRVITHATGFTQQQYYLAAQADEIYLDPLGAVLIEGFGVYRKFFSEALDKLDIDVHVFRVGDYKSAIEPFTRKDMSSEARAANQAWLEDLWSVYTDGVAGARGLEAPAVHDYADQFSQRLAKQRGNAAEVAQAAGLVDELLTREQMRDKLRKLVGRDDEHGSFRQVHSFQYYWARRQEKRLEADPTQDQIGVLVAQGALVEGDLGSGTIDGEQFAWLIDSARRNKDISALVLRIDSPGGSVMASETIRRELELLREAGKPVVVSMSSVAASGGYWIAMEADKILAQDSTVTGSIGVFGLLPGYYKLLNRWGIYTDGVATTDSVGVYRGDRPLQPRHAQALQSSVEYYYREFVRRVAGSRGMSLEAADRLAQGRVWSGADAQKLGLVDELGGMRKAVEAAAQLAGLKEGEYRLQTIRPPQDWRITLLEEFFGFAGPVLGHAALSPWLDKLQNLQRDIGLGWLSDPLGVHAHCLCVPDTGGSRQFQP